MKFTSLSSKLAVAAPLALVGVFGVSQVVVAQPAAKAGKGRKARIAPKMQEKIEALLGKPLTDEQKTQIATASKEQRDAVKAAQDKFDAEVVKATGLTLDQVKDLKKRTPKAGGAG